MKLLLDTQIALWWVNEHERLSSGANEILLDDANTLYMSIVSAWEISIKVSLGKLPGFSGGVNFLMAKTEEMPILWLPILPCYLETVETLPFIHRDPFDRLLVATAKTENMTILTADENIRKYDVSSVW